MISHPLQAWHHTHCIRHHTQCISFITNSPLISHPHLYDITPTICVTSYSPYTTSHPLLMSSHYLLMTSKPLYTKPHPVCRSTYTLYMWHHNHCSVSSHPLLTSSHPLFVWHHTRHINGKFCTIQNITSSHYGIKPPFLWHHTHYIWDCIHCISVITSTVLMISHQLYLWDLLYLTSYPLYTTSQPMYVCHHTHSFDDITPFWCRTSHPLYL